MSGDTNYPPPLPSVQEDEPTEEAVTAAGVAANGEPPMGMSSIAAGGGVGLGRLADGADADDDPDAVLAVGSAPGGGGGGGRRGGAGDTGATEELEAEEQRWVDIKEYPWWRLREREGEGGGLAVVHRLEERRRLLGVWSSKALGEVEEASGA